MRGTETPKRIVTNFCTGVEVCPLPIFMTIVAGFGRGGGSNFGLLHLLASSFLRHTNLYKKYKFWRFRGS